jgi:hypothetical protein
MTNEKSYIHVLNYLFEKGDEKEIKEYILSFRDEDDEYDIFIQKLQEFAKMDNFEVIEEMLNDETLLPYAKCENDEFEFDDEQDFENYLFGGEEHSEPIDEIMEQIPEKDEEDDEESSPLEDIGDELGIKDLSK